MRKKNVIALLLLFAFSAVVFAGGGGERASEETTKISYWVRAGVEREEFGQYVQELFTKEYPNIELDVRVMPHSEDAGANPFMIAVATGTMANITDANNMAVGEMARNDGLVDLPAFPDFLKEKEKVLEGARSTMLMTGPDGEDHYYKLCTTGSAFMSAFNVDLAISSGLDPSKPPVTWDDYAYWAKMMTKDLNGDGEIDQWGTNLPIGDVAWMLNDALFILYQGTGWTDLVSKDGKHTIIYDYPDEVRTWALGCKEIYQNEYCPREELTQSAWLAGKQGLFMLSGPWSIAGWQKDAPDLNFDFFSQPHMAGSPGIHVGGADGNVIWKMNTKTDAQMKASWELLKMLSRPDVVRTYLLKIGGLPAVKDVELGEEFAAYAPFVEELSKIDSAINPRKSTQYGQVRNVLVVEYNKMIRNKITVDEFLVNVEKQSARFFQD